MLYHTERPGTITVDPDISQECVTRELETFQYYSAYRSPAGDLLPGLVGCACEQHCSTADCPCVEESSKGTHALKVHGRSAGVVTLLECGPACPCGHTCPARTTQQGLSVAVKLAWSQLKGWCVHAAQDIPQGAFVCHYVGQYVTAVEARRRLAAYDQCTERGHALLTVRLQLPSQSSSLLCCIDATREGNIAHFINHSCDGGNLEAVLVTMKGYLLPRVALFSARDIRAGEELTFAYCYALESGQTQDKSCEIAQGSVQAPSSNQSAEGSRSADGSSRRRCHCGTAACSGYLPSAL